MASLNCKVGDLVRYVGVVEANYGRFARVVQFSALSDGEAGWRTEPSYFLSDGNLCYHVADRVLRPIRDPGSDAVDEMVKRLGVPVTLDAAPPNIKVGV